MIIQNKKLEKLYGDTVNLFLGFEPAIKSAQLIFDLQKKLLTINEPWVAKLKLVKPKYFTIPLIELNKIAFPFAFEIAKMIESLKEPVLPAILSYDDIKINKGHIALKIGLKQDTAVAISDGLGELFGKGLLNIKFEKNPELTFAFYEPNTLKLNIEIIREMAQRLFLVKEKTKRISVYQEKTTPLRFVKFDNYLTRRI